MSKSRPTVPYKNAKQPVVAKSQPMQAALPANKTTTAETKLQRVSYTVNQVAEMFGISRSTVNREISNGKLKSFKLGGRRLISAQTIAEALDSNG